MTFQFGPFQLDEPARVLRLARRELPLQPRVFDLLVYLINSRARVVSKDELLDAIWPGVTVTENSLQRAVSTLRGVLREGGMEEAVRNFPRNGYRFCMDLDGTRLGVDDAASSTPNVLDAAANAVATQHWNEAVSLFEQAERTAPLGAADLESWAFALQCRGNPSDAVSLLLRSIAAYSAGGDHEAAAANAVSLSTIHLERDETAVAKGWLARARDYTNASPGSVVAGQVMWMQARVTATEGDPEQAVKLAEAAYEFGRSHGDVKIEALGLMYRGFYRLSLGDTQGGLADQDHAAAIALSHNIDPVTGSTLYCNILWACRTFGDWARANQWTNGYEQFCTENHMGFSGSCQLHRAEILGVQGSLRDAASRVESALAKLAHDAPWALGDAHRVLGDIQSAMGSEDEAIAAYERCYALGWSPEPGYAMLLLERGEIDAACASLERSLIGQSWWTMQRRGMILAHLALAFAHGGRTDQAQALIDDLAGQESRWPMPSIRALTNEAAALLARRRGDAHEALSRLHLARQLWTSIDSRLNATRLRLELAARQLDAGDRTSAATELRTAAIAAEELGSLKLLRQCRSLQAELA